MLELFQLMVQIFGLNVHGKVGTDGLKTVLNDIGNLYNNTTLAYKATTLRI